MRTCKAVLSYGNAFKDGNILAKALRLGTIILVLSKINGSSKAQTDIGEENLKYFHINHLIQNR